MLFLLRVLRKTFAGCCKEQGEMAGQSFQLWRRESGAEPDLLEEHRPGVYPSYHAYKTGFIGG